MKVVEVKQVENCFDGSSIKELLLAEAITKAHIFALGKAGRVQYFPHFARPFFKIQVLDRFDVKGVEGNTTIRIHLKNPKQYAIDDFCEFLETID